MPAPESSIAEPARARAPEDRVPLRGAAARIVENMEASLSVPTATSYRTIPVKLLDENRRIINESLAASLGGKISYTHLIAWAVVRALVDYPALNSSFELVASSHVTSAPEYVAIRPMTAVMLLVAPW